MSEIRKKYQAYCFSNDSYGSKLPEKKNDDYLPKFRR